MASQCDKIQQRLEQTPNSFVSMPELVQVSGSYNIHSRISDLRRRGLEIENKTETGRSPITGEMKTYSYYKLVVPEKQLSLL